MHISVFGRRLFSDDTASSEDRYAYNPNFVSVFKESSWNAVVNVKKRHDQLQEQLQDVSGMNNNEMATLSKEMSHFAPGAELVEQLICCREVCIVLLLCSCCCFGCLWSDPSLHVVLFVDAVFSHTLLCSTTLYSTL